MFKDKYLPYAIDVKTSANKIKFHLKGAPKIRGLKMFDIKGKELMSRKTSEVSEVSLDLTGELSQASGRYVVKVITDKGNIPYRVLLKR